LKQLLIKDEKILPVHGGGYESLSRMVFYDGSNKEDIRNCFNSNDICSLFGWADVKWDEGIEGTELFKLIRKCVNAENNEDIELNDNNVIQNELKCIGLKDILNKLTTDFLKQKSDKWLLDLFELIAPKTKSWTGEWVLPHRVDYNLEGIPIIRLCNNSHVNLEEKGIYLNNRKIKRTILECEAGYNFYQIVGIKELTEIQRIKDYILQKYIAIDNKIHISGIKENIDDLESIRTAINKYTLQPYELANKYILKGINKKTGKKHWCRPSSLYFSKTYSGNMDLEYLLAGNDNIYFLDDYYKKHFDNDFFIRIGVKNGLKEKCVNSYELGEYKSEQGIPYQAKYFRIGMYAINKNFDFRFCLEHLEDILKLPIGMNKSKSIWKLAEDNIDMIYDSIEYSSRENFSAGAATRGEIKCYSVFGWLLNNSEWVYGKENILYAPKDMDILQIKVDYLEISREVVNKFGFKGREKAEFEKLIENLPYDDPKRKLLEKINGKTEKEFEEIIEFMKKQENNKHKGSLSPSEAFSKQSKLQKDYENEDRSDNSGIINKERRITKLEEEFDKSMKTPDIVNKHLIYVCANSGKEEKAFLYGQYKGKCQICGTIIRKFDSKNYFVARNIIKTSDLDSKYLTSIETGWNSLCLCPNCAAEYLYCSKDISSLPQQVKSKDVKEGTSNKIGVDIVLQGTHKTIYYTPKHFLALKTALEVYDDGY